MARKTTREADERATGALELDDIYSAEQLSPALSALYSELDIEDGGQVKVYISKLLEPSGKEARIWQGTPAEYDLHSLSKRFGSGDYKVKIYVPRENGTPVLRGNKIFTIKLDPGDDAALERERRGVTDAPTMTPEAITVMIAQAVKAAMPAPVVPSLDPLAVIKGLAEVMRVMQPPQGLNALDALKTAADIFRELRGSDDVDPVQRGVNATGMDVFMKLIDRFGPALLAVAREPQAGQPAAAPALAAPQEPAAKESEAMMNMKMGLAFLVQQAVADNDPGTYAGMILDNISEADIAVFLKREDWLDYLADFDVRVRNNEKWFSELRDAVIAMRAEVAKDANDPDLTGAENPGKTH